MKIGAIIHRIESCPSTNDLAREMADRGAEEGTVIISKEQTKGRGTRRRTWFSAKNKGLYTSVILKPKELNISIIPLMAVLAVKDAIFKVLRIHVELRWPNDLIWHDKKLGGILCESTFLGNQLHYIIVGIGLNLSHEKEGFPVEIRDSATSLKLIKGEVIDESILLKNLWKALNYWYRLFCQGKVREIIRKFERYSAVSPGEKLKLITEKGDAEGIYRGIDSSGGLILEERGSMTSYFSAEIKTVT
ncbi:MAG: biotin--[acetyl-CoA-carboxylase] ligase [Candidatus Aminicenantaceae bacterium]